MSVTAYRNSGSSDTRAATASRSMPAGASRAAQDRTTQIADQLPREHLPLIWMSTREVQNLETLTAWVVHCLEKRLAHEREYLASLRLVLSAEVDR